LVGCSGDKSGRGSREHFFFLLATTMIMSDEEEDGKANRPRKHGSAAVGARTARVISIRLVVKLVLITVSCKTRRSAEAERRTGHAIERGQSMQADADRIICRLDTMERLLEESQDRYYVYSEEAIVRKEQRGRFSRGQGRHLMFRRYGRDIHPELDIIETLVSTRPMYSIEDTASIEDKNIRAWRYHPNCTK
jgi:hypothetical protein